MPDDANTMTWLELLVRMCAGEEYERPFVGVLEVPYEEDEDRWPSTVRVFKDRDRYRVETLDGDLLTIRGSAHTYVFRRNEEPSRYENDADGEFRPGAHSGVIMRREAWDWRGADFTTPTGPAIAVTFLGREAWEVELAPPEHKPSALVLTIDATNGMVYEQRSVEFGVLNRWTEITDVESHADELFEWDGEVVWYEAFTHVMTDEEVEREDSERAAWMAEHGVSSVSVTEVVRLFPHQSDDSGAFFASYSLDGHGVVARRQRSDEEWDLDMDYAHSERWSDDEWDWCVASGGSLDQVREIRRQLAEPRPKDV